MKFLRKIIENGGWVCFFAAVLSWTIGGIIEFRVDTTIRSLQLQVASYLFIIGGLMPYFYLLIVMPLKFFIDKRSFSKKKSGLILWIVLVLIVLLFTYVMVLYSNRMMGL